MATKKKPKRSHELDADDYLAAAEEHAGALSPLYARGDYALAIYVSGLTVECVFRANRSKKGLAFRSDHLLGPLAKEAGFPDLLPHADRSAYDAALSTLITGWRNAHRFRSNEAMRRFLKGLELDRHIKGDYLKENARRMSSAAITLVGLGVQQWQP
jgi:hypothetical protein